MASLILISVSIPSFASDIELAVAKAQEGIVSAAKPQSFAVILNAGDYAQIKLDPRGKELAVITYDPAGGRFRGAKIGPKEDRFNFVADRSGTYRLEVVATDKTIEGAYAITLERIVTLQARLAPLKPAYESPRISALKASIMGAKPGSIDSFWKEVEKEGSPIIEPLPGDEIRLPYVGGAPDDYFMDRLGDTSVWYKTISVGTKTRFEYSLAPNVPRIRPVSQGVDNDAIAMIAAAARPDPLNPKRWSFHAQSVDSPEYEGSSMVEMPDAPAQPWLVERPGVPAGQIEKRRFKSALLKDEREIAVYLPPGYSRKEKPYPLLLLFDEIAYLGDRKQIVLVPTPTILDNLIAAKRIPAMVALLIGNAPGARERELTCNPAFADFLSSELLPWAHGLYNFTADPRQTVVGGSRSLSGIRNHNLDLIVRAALSSAKSEAGTPALPHLFASERPQGPFSQPRHGFSLLIA